MPRKPPKTDSEIVAEAQERYNRAATHQADAHRHYLDDMRFANGDDENGYQWNDRTSGTRKSSGRPALTVNKTRIHCLQVINDARQNPVQIRINPVGDEATAEAAQIYEGIIRHIEYVSNAQAAYANATYCQVMGGVGYWRVEVEYAHDNTFNQEIFIRRIGDPTSVFLDPDTKQADASDARWGFIRYEMPRDDYDAEYGDSDDPDDANLNNAALTTSIVPFASVRNRHAEKHVEVIEYYRQTKKLDRLLQVYYGAVGVTTTCRESELPPGGIEALEARGYSVRAQREIAEPQIEWFLIADSKIIDREDWPGQYIPIVRVPCEEVIIDGKLDWISHVRHLRDPQRLYNWYTSQAAEFVALQTKAPFIGTAEAIEPYKEEWEQANVENKPVLLYKGTDIRGNPIPPPERSAPPQIAQAYIEGLKVSQAEMMMATGQYQAVMGEPSNETSGKAINARQRQGDNATYHVIDRLASGIRYTGRIILDLIPKVYDVPRTLMIMGEDGSQTQIHLDPNAPVAHETSADPNAPPPQPSMQAQPDPDAARQQALRTVFNPCIGKYAVVSDVGPAYATKRQEAFNAFSQILAQNNAAFQVLGDFWAKNADFPGADELAARLKQGLPPQYQAGAPSAQEQQLQAALQHTTQTAQQTLQQADAHVARLEAEVAILKEQLKSKAGDIVTDRMKLQIEDYKAESDRLKALGAVDPMAVQVIVRQLLRDMMATDIIPHLQRHAEIEGDLQARLQPQAQADPSALPPGMQMAHSVADLAQKHADIANTHADTIATLQPPQPMDGGNGAGAMQGAGGA